MSTGLADKTTCIDVRFCANRTDCVAGTLFFTCLLSYVTHLHGQQHDSVDLAGRCPLVVEAVEGVGGEACGG